MVERSCQGFLQDFLAVDVRGLWGAYSHVDGHDCLDCFPRGVR